MKERTIRREVSYRGMGVHTGTECEIKLMPAPEAHGVRFRRTDLEGAPDVPARVECVVGTERCTTLGNEEATVSTVEHLLAAARGLEVDNLLIEIDGPEVPIGDGSSQTFVDLLDEAGIVEQSKARSVFSVAEPTWARLGDCVAVALPHDGFRVSAAFTNDHNHPVLGDLFAEFDIDPQVFREDIAKARTIGWLSEIEALRASGLALGATMDMAVVLSPTEILTPLRLPEEPVRHKILDIIGDLSLVGRVRAHVIAVRSSHALNYQLAQAIAASASQVELTKL